MALTGESKDGATTGTNARKLASNLTTNKEYGSSGAADVSLVEGSPQWDTSGWLDETWW